MRPEFYADQYRRYACYCRQYGDRDLFKVACGASGANYEWTQVLMREAGRQMNALAAHYYCGSGKNSRSATEFEEVDWHWLLKNALVLEELVKRHSTIMDRYDPGRKVAMAIDEWGTWHACEPGTLPGFLYQQNSLRDALVASVSLDIFNRHADRVRLCNIAQTVNVLQAVILTDGPRILTTPTYHVFEMYMPHHDAKLLPTDLSCNDYAYEDDAIPGLSASASRDEAGAVHITMTNLNPNDGATVTCDVRGATVTDLTGRLLTAEAMAAHNTFDEPDAVAPKPFDGARLEDGRVIVEMPPKSLVAIELGG
jgi:alpha-N-arabinofuranosidase